MYSRLTFAAVLFAAFCLMTLSAADAPAELAKSKSLPDIQRILILDGSPVHDAGELHLHVSNWGALGSRPGVAMPLSAAPSAEYPAGSGVEYLFEAGLWVGATRGGVPAVSTASYLYEFRPTADTLDVVYYAAEGDPGGARLPDPNADDDSDGATDEEWLDGHDNDSDGAVDEDFAAISQQMLSCWYSDTTAAAAQIYPEHNSLGLVVRQRSFQWNDPSFDDFIGFDYTITNVGTEALDDVYVGLFVDPDAGNRNVPNYYSDDACGFMSATDVCTQWGKTSVEYAYSYDVDGDAGQTTGQLGVLILDHPTDPNGITAPEEVGFCTFVSLYGEQPYQDGGDPTNDFERYELMCSEIIEANSSGPADVRYVVCSGPFAQILPGESITYQIAVFAGNAPGGVNTEVLQHAAAAKLVYEGAWFDLDDNPATGVAGRETPVFGPANDVVVDSCAVPPVVIPFVPDGEMVWVNTDCVQEALDKLICGYTEADTALYLTGFGGRETQIPWTLPYDVPVPVLLTNFHVQTSPGNAVLSWALYADETIRGFRIHRTGREGNIVVLPADTGILPAQARSFEDNTVIAGEKYRYTLIALLEDGSQVKSTTVEGAIPAAETALHQNYPNPFNPATTISFTLAEKSSVTLSIFTIEGKKVVTLVDDILPAGLKHVRWNGKDAEGNGLSTGVYFYRLEAGKETLSRKMIYLK